MRIVITGGCGFVGSNIAEYLKNKNKKNKILCVDNFYRKGSLENKKRLIDNNIKVFKCDIRNEKELNKLPSFDLLIDCAADPSVATGFKNGLKYLIDTNLLGTFNCLNLVKKNKAKIIFLSSSRIYPFDKINNLKFTIKNHSFTPTQNAVGFKKNKGFNEEFDIRGLKTFYGFTKYSSEELIKEFCYANSLNYIINRCGVIAGPWQWGKIDQGFIVYWLMCYLFNKKLNYIGFGGNGNQVRDILNVSDLNNLIFLQIQNFNKFENDFFNVGGGNKNKISLKNLSLFCDNLFGIKKEIFLINKTRYGDIPYYVTDNSKIHQKSNWLPIKNAETTTEEIFNWIIKYKDLIQKNL